MLLARWTQIINLDQVDWFLRTAGLTPALPISGLLVGCGGSSSAPVQVGHIRESVAWAEVARSIGTSAEELQDGVRASMKGWRRELSEMDPRDGFLEFAAKSKAIADLVALFLRSDSELEVAQFWIGFGVYAMGLDPESPRLGSAISSFDPTRESLVLGLSNAAGVEEVVLEIELREGSLGCAAPFPQTGARDLLDDWFLNGGIEAMAQATPNETRGFPIYRRHRKTESGVQLDFEVARYGNRRHIPFRVVFLNHDWSWALELVED